MGYIAQRCVYNRFGRTKWYMNHYKRDTEATDGYKKNTKAAEYKSCGNSGLRAFKAT